MSAKLPLLDRRRLLLLGAAAAALPVALRTVPAWAAPRVTATEHLAVGRDQSFDLDWRFRLGEGDFSAPGVADADWRRVDLPHDWSIEDLPQPWTKDRFGPFDKTAVGGTGTGFTVGGEGWYRKRFTLPAEAAGQRVEIRFGGVAVLSEVWLNGHKLGEHHHAYTPFVFDLTPYLVEGENVLAVHATNLGRNSRWYAGSGLYRSVTLDVMPAGARLARDAVASWTRSIEAGRAEVEVTTRIEEAAAGLELLTELRDARGRVAARARSAATGEVRQTLAVRRPRLWSPKTPDLYTLETSLVRGRTVLDRSSRKIGVRIVTMDPETGLQINGERFPLRGGCVHHDNGLLGAATFADADERRVLLHKARGFNAFRSAHNPSSDAFLDACDKHGMLVIEEAFDSWHVHKRPQDHTTHFADEWREDLAAMVASGRNHASVIMWSIGNEITERSTDVGLEWSWKLGNEIRRLDPTRPVTAGLQEFLGRPMTAPEGTARAGHAGERDQPSTIFLDVAGYNYKLPDIEPDHALYPGRIIYASETYPSDAWAYQTLVERAPYFLGEFVWTSMDYVGEAGVGLTTRAAPSPGNYAFINFPVYNAYCGDIDLIGDQKPQSRFRDVAWGLSALEVAVRRPLPEGQAEKIPLWGWSEEMPSWTWPGHEGEALAVRIYTRGDRVELRLNGAVVESRTLTAADKIKAEFMVPYAAGTLEAVAFSGDREVARQSLTTTGAPARLALRPEPASGVGRQALHFVNVDVRDAEGRLSADAMSKVALTINGPAELIGFGSSNPRAVGSFQAPEAETFYGRALAILRGTGEAGPVRIEARAEGLAPAVTTVEMR